LRSGLDVAKAIALGANVGAMARPMLVAGDQGEEHLHAFIQDLIDELRVAMFGAGAASVAALQGTPHLVPASPQK
jgi:isopentenyl-diphosphate delta-isomerase